MIRQELRYVPTEQSSPTHSIWNALIKRGPDQARKSIATDFIMDLPNSDGYDKKLIVINHLTKMSHFIPCVMGVVIFKMQANILGPCALMRGEYV